jgi:hypothetical protein
VGYLIEAGDGVFSSLGPCETGGPGEESSKLAGSWIHDATLETLTPNEPEDHERLPGPLGRRQLLEWREQQEVTVDDRLRDVDELAAVVLRMVA